MLYGIEKKGGWPPPIAFFPSIRQLAIYQGVMMSIHYNQGDSDGTDYSSNSAERAAYLMGQNERRLREMREQASPAGGFANDRAARLTAPSMSLGDWIKFGAISGAVGLALFQRYLGPTLDWVQLGVWTLVGGGCGMAGGVALYAAAQVLKVVFKIVQFALAVAIAGGLLYVLTEVVQ